MLANKEILVPVHETKQWKFVNIALNRLHYRLIKIDRSDVRQLPERRFDSESGRFLPGDVGHLVRIKKRLNLL